MCKSNQESICPDSRSYCKQDSTFSRLCSLVLYKCVHTKLETGKSLVLLDELGRGTATFDGTAIAKSVLQHLVDKIQCTTLFVTHFKSLTQMFPEDKVTSGHMGYLKEENNENEEENTVLFLYKLSPGSASNSFGINVARMANIPESVVQKASFISEFFEVISEISK